jgi:hypothetical protein
VPAYAVLAVLAAVGAWLCADRANGDGPAARAAGLVLFILMATPPAIAVALALKLA